MTKLSNERMRELTQALRDAGRLPWGGGARITNGFRRGGRVIEGGEDYVIWYGEGSTIDGGGHQEQCPVGPEWFLDLNDPGTVGVLASQARELWGDDDLHLLPGFVSDGDPTRTWELWSWCDSYLKIWGFTRAEAWVDAILRAPGEGDS